MTIVELLQSIPNTRLVHEDKWLYWNEEEWVVLQRPYGAKKNKSLGRTESEAFAVACLLYGEG